MPINIDEYLRHETYLARLASQGINDAVIPGLQSSYLEIRRLIADGNIRTPYQLKRIVEAVEKAIIANSNWNQLSEQLDDLAFYEAGFAAEFITASTAVAVKAPTKKQVNDYMQTAMMSLTSGDRVNVGVWGEFVAANTQSRANQINAIIKRGYMRKETPQQMTRQIRQAFNGILLRESETLTRTGFQFYANQARAAMAEANPSTQMDVVFSAVFDNRTTLGCRSLNGTRWPKGSPEIVEVPRHYNCRSSHLYLPRAETLSGTRAAIGGQEGEDAQEAYQTRKDRIANAQRRRATEENPPSNLTKASQVKYRGRKDSDIFKAGQIRAGTTQDAWMKSQPAWFQNDSLGPTRARLLRSGEYDFNDFVDVSGRKLTINELKARDSELFKRLGL